MFLKQILLDKNQVHDTGDQNLLRKNNNVT